MLGNREDAEDITQEVLLKIWGHIESIGKRSRKNWIMKVTKNLCIDQLRHRRLSHSINSDPSPLRDPETLMERREMQKRIREAIGRLPLTLRSTIILREIQGLKYREISEILGISLDAVKVQIWRGRRLLRQALSPIRQR